MRTDGWMGVRIIHCALGMGRRVGRREGVRVDRDMSAPAYQGRQAGIPHLIKSLPSTVILVLHKRPARQTYTEHRQRERQAIYVPASSPGYGRRAWGARTPPRWRPSRPRG